MECLLGADTCALGTVQTQSKFLEGRLRIERNGVSRHAAAWTLAPSMHGAAI